MKSLDNAFITECKMAGYPVTLFKNKPAVRCSSIGDVKHVIRDLDLSVKHIQDNGSYFVVADESAA